MYRPAHDVAGPGLRTLPAATAGRGTSSTGTGTSGMADLGAPARVQRDVVQLRPARGVSARVTLLAVTAGFAVAGNYYAQPLLPAIAADLDLSTQGAGLVVTLTQLGYAAGLLLLVPLGDVVSRRRLVLLLVAGSAASLAGTALAPSPTVLYPAVLLVGLLSVLAQLIVVCAAAMSDERDRGRVIGRVIGAMAVGIVLARSGGGIVADTGDWRRTYWLAAALMALQLPLLWRVLPRTLDVPVQGGYAAALRTVARLLRREPVLRRRIVYGTVVFAGYAGLWTSLPFLLAAPPYDLSSSAIGLFGLAGVAAVAAASFAGRVVDRGYAHRLTGASLVLLLGGWAALWFGRSVLAGVVVGIVVLEASLRLVTISNTSEIYRLRPEALSGLTSAYMTCIFAAGAAGSAGAAVVYDRWEWVGVCSAGAATTLLLLAGWLTEQRTRRADVNRIKTDRADSA
ncbi:MAG: arabinose efflux permease family protein [Frankiales bacterium]|nr:arabinose efflux permease family protein [Frankiales bacterium]